MSDSVADSNTPVAPVQPPEHLKMPGEKPVPGKWETFDSFKLRLAAWERDYAAWRASQPLIEVVVPDSPDDSEDAPEDPSTPAEEEGLDEGPSFDSPEEADAFSRQQQRLQERAARLAFPHACSPFFASQKDFAAGAWNVGPASPITKTPVGYGFKDFTGDTVRFLNAWELKKHEETVADDNVNAALFLDSPVRGHSLVVVDVDNPRDLPRVRLFLRSHGIDPDACLTVATGREGGGVHLYLRREVEPAVAQAYGQRNGAKIFARNDIVVTGDGRQPVLDPSTGLPYLRVGGQVDIKGWRNYVVCPGATHKSGRTYDASLRGVPVLRLMDVIAKLPVLPLAAWQEMGSPMTRARWAAMESVNGGALPPEVTDNTNFAACLENPKNPRELTVPPGREAPAALRPAFVHAVKITTKNGPGGQTSRAILPTSHPAYALFAAMLEDPGHPDVVSRGTDKEYGDFVMTRAVPTEDGFIYGRNPAGRRKVSRSRRGTVIVRDFHAEVTYEFADLDALAPVGPRPAYLDVQDLGPGAGQWRGAAATLPLTPAGYIDGAAVRAFPARVKVIQSTQGTGKSEFIKTSVSDDLARGRQAINVNPTRSLTAEAAVRYGLPHYEDSKGRIEGSVAVTMMSMARVQIPLIDALAETPVDPGVIPGKAVYIDECEQNLQQVHSLGSEAEGRKQRCALIAHLQSAQYVYLFDADAGPLTVQLLKDAGLADSTVWLRNPAPHPRSYEWVPGGPAEHLNAVIEDVSAGQNIAMHCMARDFAETAYEFATRAMPDKKIVLVTPKTIEDEVFDLKRANELASAANLLIYTPAMGTGVSIDVRDYFDRVELFATNNAGDGRQAQQGVMRVRNPKCTVVRVSGNAARPPLDEELTPEYWARVYTGRDAANTSIIDALRKSNRVPCDFQGPSADMNTDPAGRMHFRAHCVAMASSKMHGSGWVTPWLCGDCVYEPRDPHRTDAGKLAAAAMTDIREDARDKEASAVAAINPAALVVYDEDDRKLPETVKTALRKSKVYGRAWECAPEAARKAIVLDDDDSAVFSYAVVHQWSLDEDGKASVVHRDEQDKPHATAARRHHRTLFGAQASFLLSVAGVRLHNPEDVTITYDNAIRANEHAERWAAANFGLHGDIKQARNWRSEPMRLVTALLSKLGIKADIERKRLPKAQGGGLARVYTVRKTEIERMRALAEHQILCLHRRERSLHSPGEYADAEEARLSAERTARMLADMEAMLAA